ncbi:hypothetical protein [Poriferisphaera corsica]|nr:hypothetical protein [Poriferisphaera corsica]
MKDRFAKERRVKNDPYAPDPAPTADPQDEEREQENQKLDQILEMVEELLSQSSDRAGLAGRLLDNLEERENGEDDEDETSVASEGDEKKKKKNGRFRNQSDKFNNQSDKFKNQSSVLKGQVVHDGRDEQEVEQANDNQAGHQSESDSGDLKKAVDEMREDIASIVEYLQQLPEQMVEQLENLNVE